MGVVQLNQWDRFRLLFVPIRWLGKIEGSNMDANLPDFLESCIIPEAFR